MSAGPNRPGTEARPAFDITDGVSVFGSSLPEPGSPTYETAYRIGRLLGVAGYTLINGGYGGTMEASARGARDAGGRSVGITVTRFRTCGPNPYVDTVLEEPDLFHRLASLVQLGQWYVVLPGSTGTLVELALVWEFLNKGFTTRKTILADRCWAAIRQALPPEAEQGRDLVRGAAPPEGSLCFCEDLPEAVEAYINLRSGADRPRTFTRENA